MSDDPDIEQEYEFDRDRHALAQLLRARRNHLAAKTVAVSHYSSAYAGAGKHQVTLAVPAELYDAARSEFCVASERVDAPALDQAAS